MALIKCPECGAQISDKAESCPHCGWPKLYFATAANTDIVAGQNATAFDYKEIKNMLILFSSEWRSMFSASKYIPKSTVSKFFNDYSKYAIMLSNDLIDFGCISAPQSYMYVNI